MKRFLYSTIASFSFMTLLAYAEVTPLSGASKVNMDQLPQPAQNTIRAQAGSAQIEDIDKGTLNGRTVYEAAFKRNGVHTELRVAEDGSVVDTITPQTAQNETTVNESAGAATSTTTADTSSEDGVPYNAGFFDNISNSKKISFSEVPANVRQLIKQRSGSAEIEDVEKGTMDNLTVYQAAYKKNGQNTEFRVAEDASKMKEVMNGKPIFWSTQVPISQVPPNILQIAKSKAGNAPIEVAHMGRAGQTPFYRFNYHKNGKPIDLRVSNHGANVKEVTLNAEFREAAGAQK
jgi:hypothetical protein